MNSQQKVFKTFCLPISFLLDIPYIPSWKVNTIYRLLQAGLREGWWHPKSKHLYISFHIIYEHIGVERKKKKKTKEIFVYIIIWTFTHFVIFFFVLRKKIDFILNIWKKWEMVFRLWMLKVTLFKNHRKLFYYFTRVPTKRE